MSELRQNEELQQDVERVLAIACKNLGPNDAALLRWACGIDEKSQKQRWAEMTCTCGDE